MSNDPYVMEESSAQRARALGSSLWEVRVLQRHWEPAVSTAAAHLLASADARVRPERAVWLEGDDCVRIYTRIVCFFLLRGEKRYFLVGRE